MNLAGSLPRFAIVVMLLIAVPGAVNDASLAETPNSGPSAPGQSSGSVVQPTQSGVESSNARGVVTAEAICLTLARTALANDLPIDFFTRLIWQESHFNSNAVSYAGAQGIA